MVVKRKPKRILFILTGLVIICFISVFSWSYLIGPVDRKDKNDIQVIIPPGSTSSQISRILIEKKLIKSELVFKVYLKLNSKKTLKASTYIFQKSMPLKQIVKSLETGNSYNPDAIKITFKEGKTIRDYAKTIEKETSHTKEEFLELMTNKEYIQSLIGEYWFLSDDILQEGIYYPLEGYLFPDTYYFKNKDVALTEIVKTLLDQMAAKLEKYKEEMNENAHEYLTFASITELEGLTLEDRKMIIGVFHNRLNLKMNLGSDVTTYYALQEEMTKDLTTEQFQTNNPYNTRNSSMTGKLPIGPICNPSLNSIEASINPTSNDYLFFVADKNGKIYYTKTNAEHERVIKEIKDKGDWIW